MKITLVALHTDPYAPLGSGEAGGMNVVVAALACELARQGHTVEVLTRRDDPTRPEAREVCAGVTLRLLPAGPPTALPKSEIDQYCDEFAAAMRGLEPPDVVHSHHWMSGVAALPVAQSWGVPHVLSYHSVAAPEGSELSAGEPTESPARVPAEARLAHESDAVVAVSSAEAQMIVDLGAAPERVVVVHPGVDCSAFRPLKAGEKPWSEQPYVLMAARLQPLKGPDLAVRAIAAIPPDERPLLVLAGGASSNHQDYVSVLERQIADLGLGASVLHIGAQERELFAQVMRGARVVVVPSHTETFGLVALEASASGVPVVASGVAGLREAVSDGVTGTLLDGRDPQRWAAEIRRYLDDPAHRDEVGAAGRAWALQQSWPAMAARMVEVYRSVEARG